MAGPHGDIDVGADARAGASPAIRLLSEVDVATLYRRVYPVILGRCRRMLGNEAAAADIAQETFTRLWRARGSVQDDPAILAAWVLRTATRLAIDGLRRRRFEPAPDEDADRPDRASEEARLGARAELRRLMAEVPASELEVVVLGRLEGLTQAEVAGVLGVSERTVRRALARFDARRQAGTRPQPKESTHE